MHSFTHIGNIINSLFHSLSQKGFSREIKIALLWKRSVGQILNRKTQIKRLEKDTLFVNVENNVWLQELILQKVQIIKKINTNLKNSQKIKNIIFSLSNKKIDF